VIDMSHDNENITKRNPWHSDSEVKAIVAATGLPVESVASAVSAHYRLVDALGLVDPPDLYDGLALRQKYPELIRPSVVGSGHTAYELESTVIQLETGLPVKTVVEIVASLEKLQTGDCEAYLTWARGWLP
jgi:hypothetical protein